MDRTAVFRLPTPRRSGPLSSSTIKTVPAVLATRPTLPEIMAFHALIAAGGNGFRFGAEIPKQYLLLHGKSVLQHSMGRLASGFPLAMTYVVVAPDDRWIEPLIGGQPQVRVLRSPATTG
jgi:hypothetical protein